jgi:hypothetical protein
MRLAVFLAALLLIQPAKSRAEWPTKGWPVSTPRAEGLDPTVLAAIDADIANGKYGHVDSMLVIRHGKVVYDRSYKHDYDRIYAEEARQPNALNAGDPTGPYNYFNPWWHPFYRRGYLHTMQSVPVTNSMRGAVALLLLATSAGAQAPARPTKVPDIYFVPTRHAVADAMLKLARVTANDIVYDLGSGDGRIVILAAQKYGARGVGVEIDPKLLEISRQVAREGEVDRRVTFIEGDLFAEDISDATVVTLYLSQGVNRRLESKLRSELKPGTRIVSHQFRIGAWQPDEVIAAEDGTHLFLWTVR